MTWNRSCVVHDNKTSLFYYVHVGDIQGVTAGSAMKMTLTNVVAYECTPRAYRADLVSFILIPNVVGQQLYPTCDMVEGEEIFGLLALNGVKKASEAVDKAFFPKSPKKQATSPNSPKKPAPGLLVLGCNGMYARCCGSYIQIC
jgi:hypothetical protein